MPKNEILNIGARDETQGRFLGGSSLVVLFVGIATVVAVFAIYIKFFGVWA